MHLLLWYLDLFIDLVQNYFLLYYKTAGKYFMSSAGSAKYNAEMYLTKVTSQAVTTNTHWHVYVLLH